MQVERIFNQPINTARCQKFYSFTRAERFNSSAKSWYDPCHSVAVSIPTKPILKIPNVRLLSVSANASTGLTKTLLRLDSTKLRLHYKKPLRFSTAGRKESAFL